MSNIDKFIDDAMYSIDVDNPTLKGIPSTLDVDKQKKATLR